MKMFLKILYGLLLLVLLLVIIVIMGGIVFNICNPHVKGLRQTDFELLGIFVVCICIVLFLLFKKIGFSYSKKK